MIVTKNLLSKFVDISKITREQLCLKLNSIGLEVERVEAFKLPRRVVVGRILSKSPHPDANKLSVCEVTVGSKVLQIVCGAKNVARDQFVAVALEGALLPNTNGPDIEIKKTDIRGVDSFGMLCSGSELGLPSMNEGIMLLDASAGNLDLGVEICGLSLFDDYLIEMSITPNRGDCLSVLGIARDIAACFNLRLKLINDIDNILALGLGRVLGVSVENKLDSCLLYRIAEIKEISLPLHIAFILALNGTLRLDVVQNFLEYASYMTGVILNAYRLDECRLEKIHNTDSLDAQLYIKKDEKGVEVVSTQDKVLSSIGINRLETNFQTKREVIILEASFIPPNVVSEIVFENNLKYSDSVFYRSSRGSNPDLEQGMNFLCESMLVSNDVLIYSGTHNIEQYTQDVKIKTTFSAICEIIGNTLSREEMTEILKRLHFEIDATCDENFFMVTVPNYRHDIANIQDLSEEILRIYGIDSIQSKPLEFTQRLEINTQYLQYKRMRQVAHSLLYNGLNECVHYVFASSSELARLGFVQVDSSLGLLNPIVSELDTLRTSLIPAMLASAERNRNLGFKSIKLFEIGSVYDAKRCESTRLNVFVSGLMQDESFPHPKGKQWDFFSFANLLGNAIGDFRLENAFNHAKTREYFMRFGFESSESFPKLLHPYQCGFVYKQDQCIGFIAKLNPAFVAVDSFVCEIAIDKLDCHLVQMKEFSRFQKSQRDLTVLLDSQIQFFQIREALLGADIENLVNVYPMDIFEESQNMTALSVRLILQSMQGTLEDKDMQNAIQKVLDVLGVKFGAKLKV